MGNYKRTTISVPADLKARMDAHEPPVNWSAVASRAFEAVVGRPDPAGPDLDMEIIPPTGENPAGVRLLDREAVARLQADLAAGRVVAVFDDGTGKDVAVVVCTNAEWVRAAVAAARYRGDIGD